MTDLLFVLSKLLWLALRPGTFALLLALVGLAAVWRGRRWGRWPIAAGLGSVFAGVGIPILGVIENESYFICDGCNKRHELFGKGGGQKVAEFADAPLLGQSPIDPAIREWGDAGTPVVQAAPTSSTRKPRMASATEPPRVGSMT